MYILLRILKISEILMSTKPIQNETIINEDYLFTSKARLMPHIDQLITKVADNNEYYKVLNSIFYLLNNTDTFNSYDNSSIFFSLTQLLTTSNIGIKRFLMILLKQINTDSESIIITQQILNEINSDNQYLKSASLRLLLSKVSEDMLLQCTPIVASLLSAELPSNVILSAIIYFNKFYPMNTPVFETYKGTFKKLVKETHRLEKDDACSKAIQYYFNNTKDVVFIKSLLPVAKSRNLTLKTLLSIANKMVFNNENIDIELVYKIAKAASNSKFNYLKYKGAKLNLNILKVKGLTKEVQLDLQKQTQEIINLFCNGDNIKMDCGIKLLNNLLNNLIKCEYTNIVENKFNLYFATNPTVSQVINTVNLNQNTAFKTNIGATNETSEFTQFERLHNTGSGMTSFEVISIIVKYNFLFDVDDALAILKEIKEYLYGCTEGQIKILLNEIINLKGNFWKLNKTGMNFIVNYLTYLLEIISKKTKITGSVDLVDCVSIITSLISERTDFDLLDIFEKLLCLNNKMISNLILDNMCTILSNNNSSSIAKDKNIEKGLKEKILRWIAEIYLVKEESLKENIIFKFKQILKNNEKKDDITIKQIEAFIKSEELNTKTPELFSNTESGLPLDLESLATEIEICEGEDLFKVDIDKFCYDLKKPKQKSSNTNDFIEEMENVKLGERPTKVKEESEFITKIKKRDDLKDDLVLNPDLIPVSSISGKINLSGSSIAAKYSIGVITNKKALLKISIENKLDEELISDIKLNLITPNNIKVIDQEVTDQQFKELEINNNSTVSNVYLLNMENSHLKLEIEFSLEISFKTKDTLTPDSLVLDESYTSKKICPQNIFLFKPVDSLLQLSEILDCSDYTNFGLETEDNDNTEKDISKEIFKHEVKKKFKINKNFDIGIMFNNFGKLFKELESKYESFETYKKYYTEDFMKNRYLICVCVKDVDEDYNKVEIKVRSSSDHELNGFFRILDILNI